MPARKSTNKKPQTANEPIIDFKLLKDGERFEHLVRALFDSMGLVPHFSGRGPDDGWDFIVYETFDGPISRQHRRKWIVQCKHLARSGRAVGRSDVQTAVLDAVSLGADGYLLITSTEASSSCVRSINSLIQQRNVDLAFDVWDRDRLEQTLLEERHRSVLRRFFEHIADKLADPVVSTVSRARSLGFSPQEIGDVAQIAALDDGQRLKFLDTVVLQPITDETKAFRTIWLELARRTKDDDAEFEEVASLILSLGDGEFASFLEQLPEYDFIPDRETLLLTVAQESPSERRIDVLHTMLAEFDVDIPGMYHVLRGLEPEHLKLIVTWTGLEDQISQELSNQLTDDPPSSIYSFSTGAYIEDVVVNSYEPKFSGEQLTVYGEFEMYITLQHGSDSDMERGDGSEFSTTATGKYCAEIAHDGSISMDVTEFEYDPFRPDEDEDDYEAAESEDHEDPEDPEEPEEPEEDDVD